MIVEIIKDLPDWGRGDACLVRKGDEYFVVSSVMAPYTGFETLVFHSNRNGRVDDWGEVAGSRGMSREEAIAELNADSRLGFVDGSVAPEQLQSGEEK